MFHQHLSTSLWTTRCIPWIYVWLNWVTVLFIIKNLQNSKMATIPNSHKLFKSTRILNLFIKSNWREWFTTQKSCQVSIWSVFSVINISFSVNLFLKFGQIGQILHKTDMCFISWPCKEHVKYISKSDLCSCVHPACTRCILRQLK